MTDTIASTTQTERPPLGTVIEERRSSGQVAEVRFPERTIVVTAMPYNEVTPRADGRYTEMFAPGSFTGLETRNGKIRVNREHVLGQPVGKVTRWVTDDDEHLIGEVRIAPTVHGDETLTLADEGILDASVGFWPMKGGEQWTRDRKHRTITSAYLHHLAFTADPAYQGAQVLEVRHDDMAALGIEQLPPELVNASSTPVRDALVAMLIERGQLKV